MKIKTLGYDKKNSRIFNNNTICRLITTVLEIYQKSFTLLEYTIFSHLWATGVLYLDRYQTNLSNNMRLNTNFGSNEAPIIWDNDWNYYPDSKVHGANMGLIWGQQDPGGPHVGPINIAIWVILPIFNDPWITKIIYWADMANNGVIFERWLDTKSKVNSIIHLSDKG